MSFRFVFGLSAVLLFGCGKEQSSQGVASSPTGPSNFSATSAMANSTAASHVASVPREVMVNMQDACDPDTFNAAVGPGTCVRNGGVTFEHFIETLTRLGSIGAWHFAPPNPNARVGQSFLVTNHGGEVHTFTEVEEFGGGIVPMLNDLAHVPNVAPECKTLGPSDFVASGATFRDDIEEEGVEKYQCCIHPWMRLEVHVTEK